MADDDDDLDDETLADLYHESGNERDRRPGIGDNAGIEPDEAIDAMDFNDLMLESRMELLRDLAKAVKQGIATPAEKNTLRQFLKDNGMIMGSPDQGASSGPPREKAPLPTYGDPEYAPKR
ncbi:hypothetical protein [Mesorhizobium sp. M0767]|uniref:hypothetical protein n=1 Tax=Mesorhizobium sp. M0767 TaxID=2956995 RepID=UPI0033378C2D